MSGVSEEERARREPTYYLKMLNPETRATLEQLYQQLPESKASGEVHTLSDIMCVCVCVCV